MICFNPQEVGFHTPGSLRLCTSPDRMDEARYQMARQGWNKAPQWLVNPDEIHEMFPLLNMDGVSSKIEEGKISVNYSYCFYNVLPGFKKLGSLWGFPVLIVNSNSGR